jgi:predicted type IV restriction endonuclease
MQNKQKEKTIFKSMNQLNLPAFEFKLKKEGGKHHILDLIRKKYVVLTPEEWVRQHFVHFLINDLKYPKTLFKVESGLKFNTLSKRSDILIHDREGKPWMLVECKSPDIKLTQKAFNQVAVYNMTIGAKYLAVTNGMVHFCCVTRGIGAEPEFLKDFPPFE